MHCQHIKHGMSIYEKQELSIKSKRKARNSGNISLLSLMRRSSDLNIGHPAHGTNALPVGLKKDFTSQTM